MTGKIIDGAVLAMSTGLWGISVAGWAACLPALYATRYVHNVGRASRAIVDTTVTTWTEDIADVTKLIKPVKQVAA